MRQGQENLLTLLFYLFPLKIFKSSHHLPASLPLSQFPEFANFLHKMILASSCQFPLSSFCVSLTSVLCPASVPTLLLLPPFPMTLSTSCHRHSPTSSPKTQYPLKLSVGISQFPREVIATPSFSVSISPCLSLCLSFW